MEHESGVNWTESTTFERWRRELKATSFGLAVRSTVSAWVLFFPDCSNDQRRHGIHGRGTGVCVAGDSRAQRRIDEGGGFDLGFGFAGGGLIGLVVRFCGRGV